MDLDKSIPVGNPAEMVTTALTSAENTTSREERDSLISPSNPEMANQMNGLLMNKLGEEKDDGGVDLKAKVNEDDIANAVNSVLEGMILISIKSMHSAKFVQL